MVMVRLIGHMMNRVATLAHRSDAWYLTGAAALSRATAWRWDGVYACPLCMRGFRSPSELTREHVPPKAVGGKEMVLTCAPCTNVAGSALDVHWDLAQRGEMFAAGALMKPTKARLRIADDSVPVTLTAAGDGILLIGAPQASEPGALRRITDHYEAASLEPTDFEFHIEFGEHHPRRAQVSHLRAGYLAAFAKFGYRYAARLALVRQQIAFPGNDLISNFHVGVAQELIVGSHLFLGEAQGVGPCIVATMGSNSVVLPPPLSVEDGDFWRAVAEHAATGAAFQFRGDSLGWPQQPQYLLDE